MLIVFSTTWLPAEESSMSVMQLPEKHDHQWYRGVLKELRRPMSMTSEDDVDWVDSVTDVGHQPNVLTVYIYCKKWYACLYYNKYERYYWTWKVPACLLTLLCHYGKPCLCINIHHYASSIGCSVTHRAATSLAAAGLYSVSNMKRTLLIIH